MQLNRFLFSCFFIMAVKLVIAQELALNLVPDSLKLNANAIIRYYDNTTVVESTTSMKIQVHKAVTILNRNGEEAGLFIIGYDNHIIPSGISIRIYDAEGKLLRKIRSDEIKDYSAYDGMSIYTDNRVKFYRPVVRKYPYSIEFSYTLHFKGYVGIPAWAPVTSFNTSIEHAALRLKYSDQVNLRYKSLPEGFDPLKEDFKNDHSLTWELRSLIPFKPESYMPEDPEIWPRVFLSPDKFGYDGSEGDLSNWNSYGRWIASLLENRQELPEETKNKVAEITNGLPDDYLKAEALYRYLQERMRYVSIQYGVGGFQPFSAKDVDKWNYGDCKALTNYYVALLKAAGIRGLYAVTVSDEGMPRFFEDFPANIYFNHVVAAALLDRDTVWAECTSSYFPFGFMGPSTAGNPALVILPEGGKLLKIPKINANESNLTRILKVDVFTDGSSKLKLCNRFTGGKLPDGLKEWMESPDVQKNNLYKNLDYRDIRIDNFVWDYKREGIPMVVMNADFSCNRFASVAGDRLIVPTLIPGYSNKIPDAEDKRINPIQLSDESSDFDTISISYPSGYQIEQLPENLSVKSEFGDYTLNFSVQNDNVIITRYLKREKGLFPPEKYIDFREFYKTINKAERQKLVLKFQE